MYPRPHSYLVAALVCSSSAFAQGISLESMDPRGFVGANDVLDPMLSSDGKFLLFTSYDPWTPDDTAIFSGDVFVRNRLTGSVRRVSVNSSGDSAVLSNGASPTTGHNGISADGRYVVFTSDADNLVPGDTNGWPDVFVHDVYTSTTSLVSVANSGAIGDSYSHGGRISADGRFVCFSSPATNLVAGDTNGVFDVFVRDTVAGTTERVSVTGTGAQSIYQSNLDSMSDDGRFVVFESTGQFASNATNTKVKVFVRDRLTGTTTLVSCDSSGVVANGNALRGGISANGRFVAFYSTATNLAAGDTDTAYDVFLRDLQLGTTTLVSWTAQGNPYDYLSYGPCSVSSDGRFVAFTSRATDLVGNDTNGAEDGFVRDMVLGKNYVAGIGHQSAVTVYDGTHYARVTPDGRYLSFAAQTNELVHGVPDVGMAFVRDLAAPTLRPIDTYGQSITNSLFCHPEISATGEASVSGPGSLWVTASNMIPAAHGQMFWGFAKASLPFATGFLLVAAPRVHTGLVLSDGSFWLAGVCDGTYSFHFSDAYIASKGLTAGTTIYAQYWQIDSANAVTGGNSLTEGVRFTIAP